MGFFYHTDKKNNDNNIILLKLSQYYGLECHQLRMQKFPTNQV